MTDLIAQVTAARSAGKISATAEENLKAWITDPRYAEYVSQIAEHVASGRWKELEEAFWMTIPFGTAGRRGKMYPIGTAAINERTIGESAQGLADYLRSLKPAPQPLAAAIACDTRHRSPEFSRLCAEILAAAGFTVYFFDQPRPTPELAFAVRHYGCDCGIMISASHNPPSDNAIKVFWSNGGQIKTPHDERLIDLVGQVTELRRMKFEVAKKAGQIKLCKEEMDPLYRAAVVAQGFPGPRGLKILYTPLHGVGLSSVPPVLAADGFKDVHIYQPHAEPSGDFPNVPQNVANPENPAVFDAPIEQARREGFDVILATDPDADRLGCAAPLTMSPKAEWRTLSGNQLGALMGDYLLRHLQAAGRLTPEHYVVKTLVTSDLLRRVADSYGVRTIGDVLTGFKWIGGRVDELGPDRFVLGTEEAHGYLAGTYCRDKDGAVASLLIAELAAEAKAAGRTLHEELHDIYRRVGCHAERTVAVTLPGADGMARMSTIMAQLRKSPPKSLGGMALQAVRDYQTGETRTSAGKSQPLAGPQGDVLFFDLDVPGNYAAVRPSGTEPKLKFYLYTFEPPEKSQDVPAAEARLSQRLDALERDFLAVTR